MAAKLEPDGTGGIRTRAICAALRAVNQHGGGAPEDEQREAIAEALHVPAALVHLALEMDQDQIEELADWFREGE